MAAVGELWVSWFSCCVAQPQKRRHRIDRSMIGAPTNFQHTAHIGRDVEMPGDQLIALQNQMKSKGGYEMTYKAMNGAQIIMPNCVEVSLPVIGGLIEMELCNLLHIPNPAVHMQY